MSTACPEIHKPNNLVNPRGPHRTAGLVTCLDLWPHPEYVRNTVAFWTLDTISLQRYSQCDGVILKNNVNLFLSKNGTDIMHFFFHRIFFCCNRHAQGQSWSLAWQTSLFIFQKRKFCMTASMQSQKCV